MDRKSRNQKPDNNIAIYRKFRYFDTSLLCPNEKCHGTTTASVYIHCTYPTDNAQMTAGERSSAFHGSTVWYSLSSALCDISLSLNTIKRLLKTHIFSGSSLISVSAISAPFRHTCLLACLLTYLLTHRGTDVQIDLLHESDLLESVVLWRIQEFVKGTDKFYPPPFCLLFFSSSFILSLPTSFPPFTFIPLISVSFWTGICRSINDLFRN